MFVVFVLHIRSEMHTVARGNIYTTQNMENVPTHTVAVVLGARVHSDGRLSSALKARVDAAIELYKAGKVQKLLMSGDNRTVRYNEVSAMRNYAIDQGIPSDDIVRDFAGFRTYDSIYRAKELWDLDGFVIVSQRFHLPRALYIAQRLGLEATGVAASERRYSPHPRTIWRERFAWILAWLDVKIGRDPYFLGPKETLSGNAQKPRTGE